MQDRSPRKDLLAIASARIAAPDGERLATVSIRNLSRGGALVELREDAQDVRFSEVSTVYLSCSLFPAELESVPIWWSDPPSRLLGVRFVSVDASAMEAVDKYLRDQRTMPRQDSEFIGSVRAGTAEPCVVIVENISVSGALVHLVARSASAPRVGDQVEFSCQYLFIGTIECPAQVAWVNDDGLTVLLGLRFQALREADRVIIERFVG